MTPQQIVDEVVKRTTEDGYPPELTHKMHLFDCSMIKGMTDAETVARNIIEGYHGKAAIICAMTHLQDVISEN
jgi:hypothetical protein